MIDASAVARAVEHTWSRIERAGGSRGGVRLVAVTKGFGAEAVQAAVACGVLDLGESYAQELVTKAPAAPAEVRWHFLGTVQRRKVKDLAPHVLLWHTVLARSRSMSWHAAPRAPPCSCR